MAFRITTGMKMNTYRYNLMQSINTLADAERKVTTGRKFSSYAESPADATNAWRVRRNYMDNVGYKKENKDTTTRYQSGWLTMGTIHTHLEQYVGKTAAIRAANDPTAEAKKELGNVLANTAETVVQAMNGCKYGDEFVFGGTDGTSPPFSWEGDHLYYRGIDLTPPSMFPDGTQKWPDYWGKLDEKTGIPKDFAKITEKWGMVNGVLTGEYQAQETMKQKELKFTPDGLVKPPVVDANGEVVLKQAVDSNGNPVAIKTDGGDVTSVVDGKGKPVTLPQTFTVIKENGDPATVTVDWGDETGEELPVINEKGEPVIKTDNGEIPKDQRQWYVFFKNMETLNKLSDEVQYADLGMGMEEDENGNMINGTYFNNALPGINMLGYGVDEDGDSKNLALLMKKFDQVLSKVDSNGTVPDSEGGNQRVIDLLGKFDAVCDFTRKGYSKIDTEAKFLTSNDETLGDQTFNLNEQILNLENVDPAEAISQFMWDYNCFNAALKIGTQLLSQSLLDYMR